MEKSISLNGMVVSYLDNEKMDAQPLVLLHGNSLAKEIYEPLFKEQSLSNFRLVAIDFPGHGKSAAWETYSIPGLAKFCIDFMSLLNLSKPVIVGHSLGGHVGIHVASKYSVKNLLAIGTPLIDNLETFNRAYKNPEALALFAKDEINESEARLLSSLIGLNDDGGMALKTDKKFRSALIASVVSGGDPKEARLWHDLSCKKNVLIGEDDQLVNADLVRDEALEGEFVILPAPCGHTPSMTSPNILAKKIADLVLLN